MLEHAKVDSWVVWLDSLPPGVLVGAVLGAGVASWGQFIVGLLLKKAIKEKK
jgi:hypothetical protein